MGWRLRSSAGVDAVGTRPSRDVLDSDALRDAGVSNDMAHHRFLVAYSESELACSVDDFACRSRFASSPLDASRTSRSVQGEVRSLGCADMPTVSLK